MPKLVSAGLNGYDTLSFDGITGQDDVLQLSANVAGDLNPGTGGMTIFLAMKLNSTAANAYIFRKGNFTSSADQGWSIATTTSDRVFSRLNADDVNDNAHKAGRTHSFANLQSTWVIYSMVIDGSLMETFLNGEDNYTNTWYSGTYTGSVNPPDSSFLGVNMNGELAEVWVYGTEISAADQHIYTIPNRLNYHTINSNSTVTGSHGGMISAQIGDYLPDPIIFHCPLAPYNYNDPDDVFWQGGRHLNSSYFLLWNYLRKAVNTPRIYTPEFEQQTNLEFVGPRSSSDDNHLLVSDTMNWINNALHPFEWQSSHPFDGSNAVNSPYSVGPPTNASLEFGQHVASDRTMTLPDITLNAGYSDGSVQSVTRSDMYMLYFTGNTLLYVPRWW